MTCPRTERLTSYLLGDLPPSEQDSVSAHLDACPVCQARVEPLEGVTDALVEQLRQVGPGSGAAADPELDHLTRRAKALGGAPQVSSTGSQNDTPAEPVPQPRRVGDYEILKKLGAGTFGTVYLGRGLLLQRLVAIKILQDAQRANPEAKARFLQEMKAVGQLQAHPHVVQAFQASEQNGTLFLVMEYVEGTDLGNVLRRRKVLSLANACEAVRQAALGLHYVHENGLVHRDVKPGNLMVTAAGQVKVLDLGLARLAEEPGHDDRRTTVGQIMGTLDYMAPEQARDARLVDGRADIYSLGCTLYRLATGRVPFPGDNKLDKIDAHRQRPVPVLADVLPDVPNGVQAVLNRMMAKDPAQRYPTALALANDLEPFCKRADLGALLQTTEGTSRPSEPTTVMLRPRRRRLWPIGILAALLLVGVGFSVSRWYPGEQAALPRFSLSGLRAPARSLAFAPDGRQLAADDGTYLYVWGLDRPTSVVSWEPLGSRSGLERSNLVFLAHGRVLIGLNELPAGSRLQWYDTRDGEVDGLPERSSASILCLAVSRDAGSVFAADNDGWGRVRESTTKNVLHEFRVGTRVRAAVFAADGQRILYGGDDGVVRLSDLEGNEVRTFPGTAAVSAVALSSDGRRIAVASEAAQTLRVWDTAAGEAFPSLLVREAGSAMTCAAFAPEGDRAVTGHADGSVIVWDLDRRESVARDRRHEGAVTSVALAPDGRWVASAGKQDRRVWLHRLPTSRKEPN